MERREAGARTTPVAGRALLGALPIFLLGALLHFAFDWSGGWRPLALVAAVNESVWEHLKIAFWPGLLWASAQRATPSPGAYWAGEGVGLFCVSAVIVLVFYGYTALLGDNLLPVDIGLFAAAIALGRLAAAAAAPIAARIAALRIVGVGPLLAQIAAFACFTYAPPAAPLFEDPRNGRYGLEARQ